MREFKLTKSVTETRVGEFAEPVETVERFVRTRVVVEYFENRPDARCVVVVNETRPAGIIVREKLFSSLGMGYGRSVYLNRPVELVMSERFLRADFEESVESVSRMATRSENTNLYDSVIVTRDGHSAGIVSVTRLLELTTGNQIEVVQGQARILGATSDQISGIARMAHSIEESSRSTEQIAQGIQRAVDNGDTALEATLTMIRIMEEAVEQQDRIIARLEGLSLSIAPLSGTIRSVAERTHMLALNASIEAARAGSGGRGFGVVADEVKKLADKTTTAAGNIDEVVGEILAGISGAVETSRILKEQTRESRNVGHSARSVLGGIGESVRYTLEHMEGVFRQAEEIANSSRKLNDVVGYLANQARKMTVSYRDVME